MTDEIKLKACPFCGGEAEIIQEAAYKAAHCKNRDCELFYTHIPLGISLIGKDWQSRPQEDKLRELIGELVKDGERLASWSYPFTTLDDIENGPYCTHCHKSKKLGHDEYCPVSKHSALMSKVKEVEG